MSVPRSIAPFSIGSLLPSHPADRNSAIPSFSQRGQRSCVRKCTAACAYSWTMTRRSFSRSRSLSSPPAGTRIFPS